MGVRVRQNLIGRNNLYVAEARIVVLITRALAPRRGYCSRPKFRARTARFALIATTWKGNCKNGRKTREPRAAHLRDRKPRAAALCRAEVL